MNRSEWSSYLAYTVFLCVFAISVIVFSKQVHAEPIAYIGHGAMFNKKGEEIKPTSEFIRSAQSYYINELKSKLSTSKQLQAKNVGEQLKKGAPPSLKGSERYLISDSLMINWLVDNTQKPINKRTSGKMKLLNSKIDELMPDIQLNQELLKKFEIPNELRRSLNKGLKKQINNKRSSFTSFLMNSAHAQATTASGNSYIQECRDNGVPIPPDWGSDEWIKRGTLKKEFISSSLRAQVYTYNSTEPEGSCIALPRRRTFGGISLLGIICLGKLSSKACFWDNQQGGDTFDIGKNEDVPLEDFAGGAELVGGEGGPCTSCHAGENPFVIHPDTVLGLSELSDLTLFSDDFYTPIVGAEWFQNETPLVTSGACSGCHTDPDSGGVAGRFPSMSAGERVGYCGSILKNALHSTMPPSDPGSADRDSAVIDMCLGALDFAPIDASCSVNNDCLSNKCQGTGNNRQCVCNEDNDCASGEYCNNRIAKNRCLANATIPVGQGCVKNAECTSNKCQGTGDNRQCVCNVDSDCGSGQYCNNRIGQNRCLANATTPIGQSCTKNAECTSNKCQGTGDNRQCVCNVDSDCGSGQYCNNRIGQNRCLADSSLSLGAACNKNKECSSNKCESNQCVCRNNSDCPGNQRCRTPVFGTNRCE